MSAATVCGKCHVLPVTTRCPEAPHDRCHHCWNAWFNEGYQPGARRHPGRWTDKTRAKRAGRLMLAAVRRYCNRLGVRPFNRRTIIAAAYTGTAYPEHAKAVARVLTAP